MQRAAVEKCDEMIQQWVWMAGRSFNSFDPHLVSDYLYMCYTNIMLKIENWFHKWFQSLNKHARRKYLSCYWCGFGGGKYKDM